MKGAVRPGRLAALALLAIAGAALPWPVRDDAVRADVRVAQSDSSERPTPEGERGKAEEETNPDGTSEKPPTEEDNNSESERRRKAPEPDLSGLINDLGNTVKKKPPIPAKEEVPPITPKPKPPFETIGEPPLVPPETPPYGPPGHPPPHAPLSPPPPHTVEGPPPPHTPEYPPPHVPPPPPPPYTPEHPPPHTPEHPPPYTSENVPCCGMVGNVITYPVTSDPMEVPKRPVAPRDVAAGAYQVLLHNGAFFQNQQDLMVSAVGLAFDWTRHWKGQVAFRRGGLMGHGWDFSYNKRIVPFAKKRLDNGLEQETVNLSAHKGEAKLTYYDGAVDAENDEETHSEIRTVENFDTTFVAYVTTYNAPRGTFHEIERYILLAGPHPFAGHPNVPRDEKIFYVLREKNGTRYVFNCRGQLIYILSRNDSKQHPVRVELDYLGPLNPLTENPMLSLITDASGHTFKVTTENIERSPLDTNFACKHVAGIYDIPRIKTFQGAGFEVEYHYGETGDGPELKSADITTDVKQTWDYGYDGSHDLVQERTPNECAKGAGGKPYFFNRYDGERRVVGQTTGAYTRTIDYGGGGLPQSTGHTVSRNSAPQGGITVTGEDKSVKQYVVEYVGMYPVIRTVTVHDPKGGIYTTTFEHDADTQVTRITNPKKNGIAYVYEKADSPVTLGPIRDWVGHYTYENDLARGNLLSTKMFGFDGNPDSKDAIATEDSYEHLYNQLDRTVDPLGNVTKKTYRYMAQGERGNPITVQGPPLKQPKGAAVPATTVTFAYNDFGQPVSEDHEHGRVTGFKYNGQHYLERIDYPGGAFDTFGTNVRGEIMEQGGSTGTLGFERNGRGLVTQKTVGPESQQVITSFKYDLDNNITDTRLRVADTFYGDAKRLGISSLTNVERVVSTEYDVLDRKISETTEADKKKLVTTYKYGPEDHIVEVHSPSLNGKDAFVTRYIFDARGLITDTILAFGTKEQFRTQDVYDENGDTIREVDYGGKANSSREMGYDGFGRLDHIELGTGTAETYRYDKLGNVTHLDFNGTKAPDGTKGLLAETDTSFDAYKHQILEKRNTLTGGFVETEWYHDADGRLTRQVQPNGGELTYKYDKAGRVSDTTGPLEVKTHNIYDARGNLWKVEETAPEQSFAENGSATPHPVTRTTTTTYNEVGRQARVQSAADDVEMFYDSAGEVRATVSEAQGTTIYSYDGFGRRTGVSHNGNTISTKYTPGGLVEETDSPSQQEVYEYDALGHTTSHYDKRAPLTVDTYHYDGLGRQDSIFDGDSTFVKRRFDDAGLPLTVTITPDKSTGACRAYEFEGKFYPAVETPREETYVYDGLGRVIRAKTSLGSIVEIKYDGLGRVLEEKEVIPAQGMTSTQIVKHEYDPHGRFADTIYPAIAGSMRVRESFDALDRTRMIEMNGATVASYLYDGTKRFAERTIGNALSTRYAYDDRLRLTRMSLATSIGTPRTLWSQQVTHFRQGLPLTTEELSRATDDAPARLMTTALNYDRDGRVTSSLTRQYTGAAAGAQGSGSESGAYSEYENGRLASEGEYTYDDAARILQTARTDDLIYSKDGKVVLLTTQGMLKDKAEAAPQDKAGVSRLIRKAGSDRISVEQQFFYDCKGNLIFDGRFIYSYDYMNRLTEVHDTKSPFRYTEYAFFQYDALGRRISVTPARDRMPKGFVTWGGGWEKKQQAFVYDGNRLIAEFLPNAPKDGQTTLLARYVFGARDGERVRMDRRPENDIEARLETFYPQEDIQGNIRLLTDERAHPRYIQNREPAPGTADAGPERPPGDENYVVGSDIRVPYLTGSTRLDGFAGTIYNEDTHLSINNYRSAWSYAIKVDHAFLHATIAEDQNRRWAVFATMLAVHMVAPYASGALAAAGFGEFAAAVLGSTLANVGMGYAQAAYFHDEYGAADALKGLGAGALGGMSGGAANAVGLGFWGSQLVNIPVNTVGGALLDVSISGQGWGDALLDNFTSTAIGATLGTTMGALGQTGGATAELSAASEELDEIGTPGTSEPTAKAALPEGAEAFDVATVFDPNDFTEILRGRERYVGDAITDEEKLFDKRIMTELRLGTDYSREFARRIASGDLKVLLHENFPDHPTARGYFDPTDPGTIHLNLAHKEFNTATGRSAFTKMASVVVHEGTHYLGGGELSAHFAQAQFLVRRSPVLEAFLIGSPINGILEPHISSSDLEMIAAYRSGRYANVLATIIEKGGGRINAFKSVYFGNVTMNGYPVDSFLDKVPLRTGWPDIDRYLGPQKNGSRY